MGYQLDRHGDRLAAHGRVDARLHFKGTRTYRLGPSKRAKRKQKAESEQSENIEETNVGVRAADIEHLAAQVISHASERGITIGTAETYRRYD